jgi:hypothetical protein
MKSYTTRQFRRLFASLPRHVQKQARQAYQFFRQNPSHPGLHFKRVHPDPPIYSARVGIGFRAAGVVDGDTIAWFWIGSHAEYNKFLADL